MRDNYMYVKGGENTFMPDDDDPQMPGQRRAGGDWRRCASPAGADRDGLFDREFLSPLWDTGFWAPVFADWGFQNRTTGSARFGAGPV